MNKHIVITGAGSGIGRAIAQQLAQDPQVVVSILGRNTEALKETCNAIRAGGGHADWFRCDITDKNQVDAAFTAATGIHGLLSACIANSGTGGPNEPGEHDRFDTLIQTNLGGTYYTFRAAERHMAEGPGPRHLIAIASILARFGVPGYTGYCASKAGILGLVRALSLELAPKNVLVNAICPGWVDTAMAWEGLGGMAAGMGITPQQAHDIAMKAVPLGRMGKPEEVAGLVAFLLSPAASGITGQGLDQNGGAWMG